MDLTLWHVGCAIPNSTRDYHYQNMLLSEGQFAMRKLLALVAVGDDDWKVLFAKSLMEYGCDVQTFSDGAQALEQARRQRYDVVIVDESLPRTGKLEFVLNLREVAVSTPLVMVTGRLLEKERDVLSRCQVFFAGTRSQAISKVGEAVSKAGSALHGEKEKTAPSR